MQCQGLLGPYQGELEKDLGNVEQFKAGLNKVFSESGLEGWEEDLALLTGQLDRYAEWVKQEIVPRGREDYRLPEEIYADNLKNFGVDMDPRQLIRMAQLGFADLQMQMQSHLGPGIAKERGWKSADYRDVMAELGKEQIPEAEVLDYYRNILKELETIIRDNELVTLPDREARHPPGHGGRVRRRPGTLPEPAATDRQYRPAGEFVLVTHSPTEEDGGEVSDFGSPASTWSLTAHEARPATKCSSPRWLKAVFPRPGSSMRSTAQTWKAGALLRGHHAAVPEPGSPAVRLKARLMRAARAFLDPMLNLGLIGKEEALELITRDVGLSKTLATAGNQPLHLQGARTGHLVLLRVHEPDVAAGRG